MPKWAKWLLVMLGVLAVLGAIALTALAAWVSRVPRTLHSESALEISATPDELLELLAAPARWPEWSAWSRDRHADVERVYSGPQRGVGSTLEWRDRPSVAIHIGGGGRDQQRVLAGRGRLEIQRCEPLEITFEARHHDGFVVGSSDGGFATHVRISRPGADYVVAGRLRLEPLGATTRVTWSEEVDLGQGFVAGLLAASMSGVTRTAHEHALEASLARLKAALESGSGAER